MQYSSDNVFAKILRNEAHCHKVYENEYTLAFLDVMPQVEGHTLIVPKEKAITLHELSDHSSLECIKTVRLVAQALQICTQTQGNTIFQHNGIDAGQTVPHVHFHVLPGNIFNAPMLKGRPAKTASFSSLEALAKSLRQCLKENKAHLELDDSTTNALLS